jgi:hypothetical protein
MKKEIKSYPKIKTGKVTKGKKIEVPAVKAAKKEVTKAEKRLSTAKQRLEVLKKAGKKDGK